MLWRPGLTVPSQKSFRSSVCLRQGWHREFTRSGEGVALGFKTTQSVKALLHTLQHVIDRLDVTNLLR